jgi:hypothetical protein
MNRLSLIIEGGLASSSLVLSEVGVSYKSWGVIPIIIVTDLVNQKRYSDEGNAPQ